MVHRRRDEDPSQVSIPALWEVHVTVIELAHGLEEDLIEKHLPKLHSEEHECYRSCQCVNGCIARMKALRRCQVQRGIAMMHAMEAPEHRHCVEYTMPEIAEPVHEQEGEGDLQPMRATYPTQQTEMHAFRRMGDRGRQRRGR